MKIKNWSKFAKTAHPCELEEVQKKIGKYVLEQAEKQERKFVGDIIEIDLNTVLK